VTREKIGLISCLYRSDRPANPEANQARLQLTHEPVIRCVTRFYIKRYCFGIINLSHTSNTSKILEIASK
jgi:hypothetical protein